MTDPSFDAVPIAEEIIAARAAGGRLAPFTGRVPGFGLDEAYQVAGIVACRRAARSPVTGRKIGFTNPALWEKAGLTHPVWGNMFEETVTRTASGGGTPAIAMAGSVEPKIECEVVVVLRSVPERGARGAAVARHVAEIGLGFEIVDSPYPGWNMRPADAVAAGGGCAVCHTHGSCTEHCPVGISPTAAIAGLKRRSFRRWLRGGRA